MRLLQNIINHVIAGILDESIVFWNYACQVMFKNVGHVVAKMTLDVAVADLADLLDKFGVSRNVVDGKSFGEKHRFLILEWWKTDYDKLMKKTIKPALSSMQQQLPSGWSLALADNSYSTLFWDLCVDCEVEYHDLSQIKTDLKNSFLHLLCKSVMAVHFGKTICAMFLKSVKSQLDQYGYWTPKAEKDTFRWILRNFPDLLEIFFNGTKYVSLHAARTFESLGARLFITSYNILHCDISADRFENIGSLLRSVVNSAAHGWSGKLEQIKMPACVTRHDALMKQLFNPDGIANHLTSKITHYPILLCQMYVGNNYTDFKTEYGSGEFEQRIGLRSAAVNDHSLQGSWKTVMQNTKEPASAAAVARDKRIDDMINNMLDHKHFFRPKNVYGISDFAQDFLRKGLLPFLFLVFAFANTKNIHFTESVEQHFDGGYEGDNVTRSDDDSLSPIPQPFRQPLLHQVTPSIERSKERIVRNKKREHRQRIQNCQRLVCWPQSNGFIESVDEETFWEFVKFKVNNLALVQSVSLTMEAIAFKLVLAMLGTGATIVDWILNHWFYATEIIYYENTKFFTDKTLYMVQAHMESNGDDGQQSDKIHGSLLSDEAVLDTIGHVFADPAMVGRLQHFIQHLPDHGYSKSHAWNNLQNKKISMGFCGLQHLILRKLHHNEICSRQVTGVVKGRSVHVVRDWPFKAEVDAFFRSSLNNSNGFVANIILDSAYHGGDSHFKTPNGFESKKDVILRLEQLIDDQGKQLQHQFNQHLIAIHLLWDMLMPILPYIMAGYYHLDGTTLGCALRDFKETRDRFTRVFYYKAAHKMDYPTNNTGSKPYAIVQEQKEQKEQKEQQQPASKGSRRRRRRRSTKVVATQIHRVFDRVASPEEKIIYKIEQTTMLDTIRIAHPTISACDQLDPTMNLSMENCISIPPLSTAYKTFSKYQIERRLSGILAGNDADVAFKKQTITAAIKSMHESGDHRIIGTKAVESHSQFIDGQLELLSHPWSMNKFHVYNNVEYDQKFSRFQFWKLKDVRKTCWKDSRLKHIQNDALVVNGVYYGKGWGYSSDLQYRATHNVDFQHALPILMRYCIDVTEERLSFPGAPGFDHELDGCTDSGTAVDSGIDLDFEQLNQDRQSSLEPFDTAAVSEPEADGKCCNLRDNCNCVEKDGEDGEEEKKDITVCTKGLDLSESADQESDSDVNGQEKVLRNTSVEEALNQGTTNLDDKFSQSTSSFGLSMASNLQNDGCMFGAIANENIVNYLRDDVTQSIENLSISDPPAGSKRSHEVVCDSSVQPPKKKLKKIPKKQKLKKIPKKKKLKKIPKKKKQDTESPRIQSRKSNPRTHARSKQSTKSEKQEIDS